MGSATNAACTVTSILQIGLIDEELTMNFTTRISLLTTTLLSIAATAFAATLDNVQFIKIAPQDAKAVIKTADGKLQVIKPGDLIGETVTVKEIATGRIVLEENTGKGVETIIVRMVNDKAKIERLSRTPERRPLLMAPVNSER